MASTLETALVFPLSFALLLSFSALVFPVYRQIRDDVQTDLPELRAAASGSEAYRAYHSELGNPSGIARRCLQRRLADAAR